MQHIASDTAFHKWSGFLQGMELSSAELKKSDEPFRRVFFISHIFVELLIDKVLLNRYPNLASELYEDYSKVDLAVCDSFLAALGIEKTDQFRGGYDRFMDVQYLRKIQGIS